MSNKKSSWVDEKTQDDYCVAYERLLDVIGGLAAFVRVYFPEPGDERPELRSELCDSADDLAASVSVLMATDR